MAQFVTQHQGACSHCSLLETPIWTPSQLAFLNEAIAQDADWAGVAERLKAEGLLRSTLRDPAAFGTSPIQGKMACKIQ